MKTMLGYFEGDQFRQSNRVNTFIIVLAMMMFAPFFIMSANAQTQSIEMGGAGSVPTPNLGPETSVTIPLVHNINNPTDNTFTPYFPNITATISFDNFQYTVSQDTGPGNPPVVVGWRFNPDGELADGLSDGEEEDMVVPFTALDESIDLAFNNYSIAQMEGFYSSTEPTPGEGIDFLENRGAFIAASFEGITADYESAARVHIADMTITFNRPINNPVLHFFGLGGFWEHLAASTNRYFNTGTVEFDFLPAESSASITGLSVLSSNPAIGPNTGLDVDGNSIISTWNISDVIDTAFSDEDDSGVANGSILVSGDDIETITLSLFARAINDITAARLAFGLAGNEFCAVEDGCYLGDSAFGWNGGDTGEGGDVISSYNIAHDLFILSISTDVDPDEEDLTTGESFRMLTSPVAGTTYEGLIGDLWVQGPNVTGADFNGGEPNIFTWPLGVANSWNATIDLADPIPAGHGFLITVFEDDEFGTPGLFPKPLSVTGSEPEPPITITNSGDSEGWMLLGNPFKDPIDIDVLLTDAITNTAAVVYVWDRNTQAYVSSDGTVGDIDSHVLMPFQGFFIQRLANTDPAEVDFGDGGVLGDTGALRTETQGTFYRKDAEPDNIVRFELNGESLSNSMWLTFSEKSSSDRMPNDALELSPLASDYSLLSTRKSDGVLLSIGQFPIPGDDFEIPVTVETTKTGQFTISATNFNLSLAHDLYFIDTEKNESIRIDENFNYTFTVNQAAKANPSPMAAFASGPQKAETEFADRFLITTQPRDMESTMPDAIALQQNYPNPFNPSTQIRYELPQQTDVRLEVYDMIGRQVATLVNQSVQAGVHTINFDASSLSSGIYLYRLQAGSTVLSRKLTVIK